jgi:hypothetical protein
LNTWTASWSLWLPTSERTTTSLSMIRASRGKASQTCTPVTFVATGFQGPAISLGA